MSTAATHGLETRTVSAGWRSRLIPAAIAAAMGAVLVFAAGFADIEQIHDAAHDVRHSAAMPCH